MDDADDAEGYYRVILGEVLDAGRYHVHANLGKGVFSSVVRAKDNHQNGKEVAIKIIRSQETMLVNSSVNPTRARLTRSGCTGTKLVRKKPIFCINSHKLIPRTRSMSFVSCALSIIAIISVLSSNPWRTCLILSALPQHLTKKNNSLNLREVVKRYGKDVGINLKAVRAYAHQMFLGLSLLRKCNLMHADLKPDNVLVRRHQTICYSQVSGRAS